ncbi:MAG: hypothetical protein KZQ91_10415 [Candidatus Thiodiazotropha sp. (ex Lucinoma borealis)]|nr:hypothetical protein [Candidatus Thiodiazotropha sp. (ex Lucinoma borealis)]
MIAGIRSLIGVFLLVGATSVQALGLHLLEFSPAKYFTAEDWAMAKETAQKALKQGKVGEVLTWQNPASGHKGSYTVLKRVEMDTQTCQDLKIKHVAGDLSGGGNYRFCLMDDGKWKTTGRVPMKNKFTN